MATDAGLTPLPGRPLEAPPAGPPDARGVPVPDPPRTAGKRRETAGPRAGPEIPVTRRRLVLAYLSPTLFTAGILGDVTFFLAPVRPGSGPAILLLPLLLVWVAGLLLGWAVALAQIFVAIAIEGRGRMSRHHLLSVAWTAACYAACFWLFSKGYVPAN